MNKLLIIVISLGLLAACRSTESPVSVGDSSASAEKALLAAGAERVLRPTAPLDATPIPIVDANGQTNMVFAEPSVFTWYFKLKDGRTLELLVQGGKVTSVKYRQD